MMGDETTPAKARLTAYIAKYTNHPGTGGDVTERLRWTLHRRLGYAALVSLVLLGLAAMHGGTSAAPSPAAHGSVPLATVAIVDTPEHLDTQGDLGGSLRASAALPITIMADAARGAGDHGMLMAGCVLALTGLVTLALALLLGRSGRSLGRYLTARHPRRPLLLSRRRALVLSVPRFSLCVLRT